MVDIYELGLLVKDIGNFNMDDFDGRLRFQKTVQLLQSFGIYLDYDYNWYLRGPYCPDLAKDGFKLKEAIGNIPDISMEFADQQYQVKYNNFKKFISEKKHDSDQLEMASSICFLRNEEGMSKDMVLKLTEGKREDFTMDQCMQIWDELETYDVVKSVDSN